MRLAAGCTPPSSARPTSSVEDSRSRGRTTRTPSAAEKRSAGADQDERRRPARRALGTLQSTQLPGRAGQGLWLLPRLLARLAAPLGLPHDRVEPADSRFLTLHT